MLAVAIRRILRAALAEKLAREEAQTKADVDAFLREWFGLI